MGMKRGWKAVGALAAFGPAPRAPLGSMVPYNLAISELEAAARVRQALRFRGEKESRFTPEMEEEQLARAERHLRAAEQQAPNDATLHFAWGRYWAARQEVAREEVAYQRAF